MLELQGINWAIRKVIGLASVVVRLTLISDLP
jgi:hypothetical protein